MVKRDILGEKNSTPNSQFLTHRPLSGGLNDLENDCTKKFTNSVQSIGFSHHCHVDVAGVELHIDLLVDHGLRVGVKVNPDTGSHFFIFRF